jgi:type I restriction enzyme S subunit
VSERYQLVRLGDLCNSISGLWTGKKPPFEKATVIRNTNFTKDCKLDLSNVAVLDVETKQLQTRKLIPGDLIVEKSGGGPKQAVGRVVYFGETIGTYSLSNFTSALRLKDSSTAFPMYLQYFLYHQYLSGVTESMQSHSTGIRNLNIHQFLDINVPLPSLEKQRAVVAKLDSAFTEIDLLEENLGLGDKKANQLLQSFLSSAFSSTAEENDLSNDPGDETIASNLVALGTVAEVIAGQSPEGIYYNSNGNGTPFYQGKKEFGEKYLGEATTWTTKITKMAEPGDILMSVRAPVGPINFSTQQICIGRGLAAIRAQKLVDKNYLFYFLLHKQPEISGNTGAVFDSINKDQIASIEIPVPSLEKQIEIVNKLDIACEEIEKLKLQIKSERDSAAALRQSLLNSAFAQQESVA